MERGNLSGEERQALLYTMHLSQMKSFKIIWLIPLFFILYCILFATKLIGNFDFAYDSMRLTKTDQLYVYNDEECEDFYVGLKIFAFLLFFKGGVTFPSVSRKFFSLSEKHISGGFYS